MDVTLLSVIALVAVAQLFDYTNGFHDSASSEGRTERGFRIGQLASSAPRCPPSRRSAGP
jgi:hypothetical protein